ncbi:NTP transferase domain-containing protein [Labrenzia sp. 011]|uniref:acylneuraminate cytidylyltransferase family protein n=1 Tax=Labrenzia sp. 011 TaxID=2171494 RepID=UPI000D521E35|nr:NTP transferase domain-containing protein [Labrenzia sp. 011]PVB59496.1 cytidyltransferase [Labrenzia sp. 011]
MSGKLIAMIPARLGSQRLKKKNLALLNGSPLIAHAIRKCFSAGCFDEVWVNSESDEIAEVARLEGAKFHSRPEELANNVATSEDFVGEFFRAHECEAMFQVHSIAPLLTASEVAGFVEAYRSADHDVLLSCIHDQIEVAYDGRPVNFTFAEKTNSQDLKPLQRITWSITGWRRSVFLGALDQGETATYHGRVGFYPVGPTAGHVIKTQMDLDIAAALLNLGLEA